MLSVVCLTLSHGSSACLLPPEYRAAADQENLAPVITPLFPDPLDPPAHLNPDCNTYRFKASVSDPDKNDIVYWRVFLDYFRTDNRPNARNPAIDSVADTADTPAAIEYRLAPSDFPGAFPVNPSLNPHLLEILIADRPFVTQELPEGRAVEAGGLLDNLVWTVILDDAVDCPGGP